MAYEVENMTVRQFLGIRQGDRPTMMDAEVLWNHIKELGVERDMLVDAIQEVVAQVDSKALIGHYHYLSGMLSSDTRKQIVAQRLRVGRAS